MSRTLVAALVGVLLITIGCEPSGSNAPSSVEEPRRIVVFAAASLTDVLGGIEASFERDHGVDVRASYAASSDLARQVMDGAPVDVFVSASKSWIEQVDKAGKLDGAFVVLARNRLVCIAPADSPLRETPPSGLRALLDILEKSGGQVGVADDGVPAGDYARQALKAVGLLDAYKPRLVGQKDVRAVLKAVESGELPIGFVYATDARVASVAVLFEIDANLHDPIEYYGAVVADASDPSDARSYLEFLSGGAGRAVLEAHGFGVP